MTNEEAIKYFKDPMNYTYEGIPVDCSKDAEAVDVSIDALEKQIPKKPIELPHDDEILYKQYICPTCEEFLTFGVNVEPGGKPLGKPHHCKCGQAIDWSGNDV